jgi:hypothetical protein
VTGTERRRYPRYGIQLDIEIDYGSQTMRGMVTDISFGGMFIATESPLWVGAMFTARLLMGEPLPVDCQVRRVVPGRGMGISFLKLSSESSNRLTKVLEALADK